MAMAIMDLPMNAIKIITRTEQAVRFALLLSALMLVAIAYVNLSVDMRPVAQANEALVQQLQKAQALPLPKRIDAWDRLRTAQGQLLAQEPADPFGWARLAYLRHMTQGNGAEAFKALRFSDMLSPHEPRQLPERAAMWRDFSSVQDDAERAYQQTLWRRAFAMQREATWALAVKRNLVAEVSDALRAEDAMLYQEWLNRIKKQGP